MENKIKSIIFKTTIIILVFVVLIGAVWFLIKIFNVPNSSSTGNNQSIEIKQNVYTKLTSPQDYGESVSTGEAGFGRANPFASYK